MHTPTRRQGRSSPFSVWMRALALFCVALVLGATSAQAAHLHGGWASAHAPTVHSASGSDGVNTDDEAACPLCMVLHAVALPAIHSAAQPLHPAVPLRVAPPEFAPALECHFPALSRPPPTTV